MGVEDDPEFTDWAMLHSATGTSFEAMDLNTAFNALTNSCFTVRHNRHFFPLNSLGKKNDPEQGIVSEAANLNNCLEVLMGKLAGLIGANPESGTLGSDSNRPPLFHTSTT